ncbi:MAG: 16S rRNA (adenine(1518)-N(6)/adenine(1519)-N(6))-dimethyltransferase RsmA [Lachnospiraceae bacterium]|nr:16S rRNA (adenine(1518)-N(6)/adenine(1519)-N(6))-dimethyltransferase RsmA [Lachnospiraceae bacterium]
MTERIATPAITRKIIEENGFYFKKSFGQNFLIDENIALKIAKAAELKDSDTVVEIGPGIGSLTQVLAENSGKVIAVEIDKKLMPILERNLSGYDNIEIINEDILKTDINKLIDERGISSVKVVANLPYCITTPVIMSLLEKKSRISTITVMVQKEVAERINAKPGSRDYGALSVAVSYFAKSRIEFIIGPNCFMPKPKVDSAVISFEISGEPQILVKDQELFFKVVKCAFGQRRKTLINSLFNQGGLGISKEDFAKTLKSLDFDEKVRGESLSPKDFGVLSDMIFERLKNVK